MVTASVFSPVVSLGLCHLLAAKLVGAWNLEPPFHSSNSLIPATYPNLTACASTVSAYSCENTTAITNACCSPTPGGLVLFTQFWSTYTGLEDKGQLLPKDSWVSLSLLARRDVLDIFLTMICYVICL
jgi:hypothetical protein